MNDLTREIVYIVARWAVSLLGAWLTARGMMVTGAEMDIAAGAVTAAFPLAPAVFRLVRRARLAREALVESAVASAIKREPLVVTLTPVGEPNVATPIPREETAATTEPVLVREPR